MFELPAAFRNPRETNFRRTPGVARRVITTFKMRTFSVTVAFAMTVFCSDTTRARRQAAGIPGNMETKFSFFAQSASRIKEQNA